MIPFSIEHMDSMGQGVSKITDKPTFIAKTLPGESGQATIIAKNKGVQFARLNSLEKLAPNRIEPACEHFAQCPGCHYLHTDYESEISCKRDTLLKQLSRFADVEQALSLFRAPSRFAYRNRIQLHYRHQYLGLIDAGSDQVLEIPRCKLIHPALQTEFSRLYQDKSWRQTYRGRGHCELYLQGDEVVVSWNKPYAHGGFTQVNEPMNQTLRKLVLDCLSPQLQQGKKILDLFSGDGNLSQLLVKDASVERVMVDTATDRLMSETGQFIPLDLFSDTALQAFKPKCRHKQFDLILVDPPRKGFPALADWVKQYKPEQLVYVSCNAATMARDLENLSGKFVIEKVALIDLFPGTYHFEVLVSLRFKKKG